MTQDRYETAKQTFRDAENTWDRQIVETFGKKWYQLGDDQDNTGEPGTPLRAAYEAFMDALERWKQVANNPNRFWAESRQKTEWTASRKKSCQVS